MPDKSDTETPDKRRRIRLLLLALALLAFLAAGGAYFVAVTNNTNNVAANARNVAQNARDIKEAVDRANAAAREAENAAQNAVIAQQQNHVTTTDLCALLGDIFTVHSGTHDHGDQAEAQDAKSLYAHLGCRPVLP